jgi:hypothetical protein
MGIRNMGRLGTNNSMAGADNFPMAAGVDGDGDEFLHQQSTSLLLGGQPNQ